MLFSSLSFIFRFLPAFLIVYAIAPAKLKNAVLLIGSLIFYSLGEPVYVFLMLASILTNYVFATAIGKGEKKAVRTVILVIACIFNVALLLFFKYGSFLGGVLADITGADIPDLELALPLGISFYTFQILSYVIDVYRGKVPCETNVIDLGAYVSMFPQLIAGPIVVYDSIRERLKDHVGRITIEGLEQGIELFTVGLGSKVLLANRFGQLWDTMSQIGYGNVSTGAAWTGAIAYTFQIYFDFNGYSLMAVGLGRMLGFSLPQNFNHPYMAKSVTDFWKRWHMTLTSFFREYVYIPLGGNRKGKIRTTINMLIVWCITGFWHGAGWNFIVWGLYYFVFLTVERFLFSEKEGLFASAVLSVKKAMIGGFVYRFLRGIVHLITRAYALLVVITGWAIFAVTDLSQAGAFIGRMFAPMIAENTEGIEIAGVTNIMYIWLFAGLVFSTPLPVIIYKKLERTPLTAVVLFAIFWAAVWQLADGVYNPFLYFRF